MEGRTKCFFFSLVPMTVFIILGYFVLFSSTKVEDPIRKFGQVLAIWGFLGALIFPATGAFFDAV